MLAQSPGTTGRCSRVRLIPKQHKSNFVDLILFDPPAVFQQTQSSVVVFTGLIPRHHQIFVFLLDSPHPQPRRSTFPLASCGSRLRVARVAGFLKV